MMKREKGKGIKQGKLAKNQNEAEQINFMSFPLFLWKIQVEEGEKKARGKG